MNKPPRITTYTTLSQISKAVNNDNLEDDIVVFDHATNLVSEDIFPMRINALIITLCTKGSGKISIDLREYDITENTLLVIQPKNYICITRLSDDFQCCALACSSHIVENVLPKLTDILPLLMHHRTEPVTQLSDSEAAEIVHFYELLRKKLRGPRTPFIKQKVLCMLQAALYEMMDINLQNHAGMETQRTRKEEIMAKFIIAVSENFREERQVSYYSRKLCITPKHLSSVVKEISGRTAGDWIENYVVMEAKVLLKTTDLTIQEIALNLHFANQSFFGKYFKHHTGMSPTLYRKTHT